MNENAAANYTPEVAASNTLEALLDYYPDCDAYEKDGCRVDGTVIYTTRFKDGELYEVTARLLVGR